MTTKSRRRVSWAVVWDASLLLGALALLAFAGKLFIISVTVERDASLLNAVSVGMTETDVIASMGQADACIVDPGQWDQEPWDSFATPYRPIDDHVLAYLLGGGKGLYAYIDAEGSVTCVYRPEVRDGG